MKRVRRSRVRSTIVAVSAALLFITLGWRPLLGVWVVGLRGSTDDGSTDISFEENGLADSDTSAIDRRPYPEVSFAATHNSYSGGLSHRRASITAQLDIGVRALELDIHDDDFTQRGFQLGHLSPGDEVYLGGGNPGSPGLDAWLEVIADWSRAHPNHAPLTLLFDLKDDLSDNRSFADGDLFALNESLLAAFGPKLVVADSLEGSGFPTVGELRGRIIAVLSGDEDSRVAYRGVRGNEPAASMDASGNAVITYDDGDGNLWYFTGVDAKDGSITWRRQARYDSGENPAIALAASGLVVEVHEDPDFADDQLWYRIGSLGLDLEIQWAHDGGLELPVEGLDPAIELLTRDRVRVVYRRPEDEKPMALIGKLDRTQHKIVWGEPTSREVPWLDERIAQTPRRRLEVFVGPDGGFGRDTLLYATDPAGHPRRIRPPQLAFVEAQHGGRSELERDGLFFYSGSAEQLSARIWAAGWRATGKVARLWCFNDKALTQEASVNFPATDLPFSRWYEGYRSHLGCAR